MRSAELPKVHLANRADFPPAVRTMAQIKPFSCTDRAAAVLAENPAVVMHLLLYGLATENQASPTFVRVLNQQREVIVHYLGGGRGWNDCFFVPGESGDGSSGVEKIIPDYPRPLPAFEIFLWNREQDACLVEQGWVEDSGDRERAFAHFRNLPDEPVYRSSDLVSIYRAFYELGAAPNLRFLDLGCGIGGVVFIASLFFDNVVGVEKVEDLFNLASLSRMSLSDRGIVRKSGIDLWQEDFKVLTREILEQFGVVYFWHPFFKDFYWKMPLVLERLAKGTKILFAIPSSPVGPDNKDSLYFVGVPRASFAQKRILPDHFEVWERV